MLLGYSDNIGEWQKYYSITLLYYIVISNKQIVAIVNLSP